MFEEYKYILPLVGVVIGWVLTEISHYFQNRKQDKKIIREAVYSIIDLKFRLEQMTSLLGSAVKADLSDKRNNEMIRVLLKNEDDEFSKFSSDLKASVKIISSIDPFIALSLRNFVDENLYLSHYDSSKDKEIQKLQLNNQLKISEVFSVFLDKIIKKILWKTDKILLLNYYFQSKKDKGSPSNIWKRLFKSR